MKLKITQSYLSLPKDKDREVQIRCEEVLTSFLIRKMKLVELTSEIESYLFIRNKANSQ